MSDCPIAMRLFAILSPSHFFIASNMMAIPFGHWMVGKVTKAYPEVPFSLIPFVPTHADRLGEREFNQSELLAKEMKKVLSLPVSSQHQSSAHKTGEIACVSCQGRFCWQKK